MKETEILKQYFIEAIKSTIKNLEGELKGNHLLFYVGKHKLGKLKYGNCLSIRSKYVNNGETIKMKSKEEVDSVVSQIENSYFTIEDAPHKEVEESPLSEKDRELVPEDFVYIPRKVITGNTDLKELEDAFDRNYNVLFCGPTGSGKSALVRKYCAKHKKPYHRVSLNGGVTVEDLVGHYVLMSGNTIWIDGILTTAVRNGGVIVIDEINAATPEVLFKLNSLLDDERILILSEKDGELVKPHNDFHIVATMNPSEMGYAGTHELNHSLKNRFHVVLEINYNNSVEQKILKQMDVHQDVRSKIMSFSKELRTAYNKGELITPWSTRDIINLACFIEDGKERLIIDRFKESEKQTINDLMSMHIYQERQVEKDDTII